MHSSSFVSAVFAVVAALVSLPLPAQSGCAPGPLGALAFNGTNARGTVPYSATFPIEVVSLSAWVRPAAMTASTQIIVSREESPTSDHLPWNLYLRNGQIWFQIESAAGGSLTYNGTTVLPTGVWSHVAATRTNAGGVLTLYLNGAQEAVFGGTIPPSSLNVEPLHFGMTRAGSGGPMVQPTCCHYAGEMDEVTMWNVALAAAQVASLYHCPPAVQSGLVGYWKFDEGTGQPLIDSSGAGNHGFLGDSAAPEATDAARIASTAPFCRPVIAVTQAAPGEACFLDLSRLVVGHEYHDIFSLEPCPGGPGTGVWLGLCTSDPMIFVSQFLLPAGVDPFHIVATSENRHYGPYALPPGITVEGVCFDFTGGALGRVSAVTSLLIQ